MEIKIVLRLFVNIIIFQFFFQPHSEPTRAKAKYSHACPPGTQTPAGTNTIIGLAERSCVFHHLKCFRSILFINLNSGGESGNSSPRDQVDQQNPVNLESERKYDYERAQNFISIIVWLSSREKKGIRKNTN